MSRILLAFLGLLFAAPAWAQSTPVYQSGLMTKAGDLAKITRNGQIVDAATGGVLGDTAGLGVNPFAVTDNGAAGVCTNNATTAGNYNALCIGHDTNGNPLITATQFGGSLPANIYASVNGGPEVGLVPPANPFTITGVPIAATNAALKALSTASNTTIIRGGFLALGDVPPLLYTASNSACSLNAGAGDNGSQVKSADNKCWLASWPAVGIDPVQFGGPGLADASAEINAALAVLRAQGASGAHIYQALDFGGHNFTITNPINMTCFSDQSGTDGCGASFSDSGPLVIRSTGATISCQTTGKACIDGLGSQLVHFEGSLSLLGACDATEPSYGLQIGRTKNNISAIGWHLINLYSAGCFTKAALYNLASEVTEVTNPRLYNNDATPGSYAVVYDNQNYWNITSTFVTEAITVGTLQSFNDNNIIGGMFGAAGPSSAAAAFWLAGSNRLTLSNVFMRTNSGTCVTIYNNSSGSALALPQMFRGDFHCEGDAAITQTFQLTSKNAATNWTLNGFRYHEYSNIASTYVFKKDANTGNVAIYNDDLHVIVSGGNPALFDTASAYTLENVDQDWLINGSGVSISGWLPTVGGVSCTGLGTAGTCTLQASNGSPGRGQIVLTGGVSPGSSGAVDVTWHFNIGGAEVSCMVAAANLSGTWDPGVTLTQQSQARTALTVNWKDNGVALASGQTYGISYVCKGL